MPQKVNIPDAVTIYRRYKNKECSPELLAKLETLLPYKRFAKIKKYNEGLPSMEEVKVTHPEVAKTINQAVKWAGNLSGNEKEQG